MGIAKIILPEKDRVKVNVRKCDALADQDVVLFNEFYGYFVVLLKRIRFNSRFITIIEKWGKRNFSKKAAKYAVKNNADAVIFYDSSAEAGFEYLKRYAPHVVRIIDHACTPRNYLCEIFAPLISKCGKFSKMFQAEAFLINKEESNKYQKEILDADYHIVASSFEKDALIYNGVSTHKIIFAPYGVDIQRFGLKEKKNKKLKALFVGEVTQRKGIYQVLEVARRIGKEKLEVDIIGAGKERYPELFSEYEPYVTFHGRVEGKQLTEFFQQADIFLFPTMGDGFGLVILEAMACGTPVISSRNCAGSDIIIPGTNGFLTDSCDTEALVETIQWCLTHREELRIMGKHARSTAEIYTWENYSKTLVKGIKEKLTIK